MQLPRIQRERAVDTVYELLHRAIVSYSIRPGERLNIEELAEELGVSLTPVRGAIQQLATEGLVEIRPRSGTFVASLTVQDIEETFKIRCALECLASEDAIENLGNEEVRRLKKLLRSLRKPVRDDEDRKTHERDNWQFHQVLIQASKNRRLIEMYEALNAHIKIARIHAGDANWQARLQNENAEHEAIVSAIERSNLADLRKALRKHIYRAKDELVSALGERERRAVS
jgi:GntR family transcriptional regulator, rspAB operon transcriptional repressor